MPVDGSAHKAKKKAKKAKKKSKKESKGELRRAGAGDSAEAAGNGGNGGHGSAGAAAAQQAAAAAAAAGGAGGGAASGVDATTSAKGQSRRAGSSVFESADVSMRVRLPPKDLGDVQAGVERVLNASLLRHDNELGGVLCAYSDVTFPEKAGRIITSIPAVFASVRFMATVFRPLRGAKLQGEVTEVSATHIGLLVFGVFSASVAADRLPPGYAYDGTQGGEWRAEDEGAGLPELTMGSKVAFRVEGVHEAGGQISIVGDMRKPSAPTKLVAAKTKAADAGGRPAKRSRKGN